MLDMPIEQVLQELNVVSRTEVPALVDFAMDMAAGVTPEREAEIAEALPGPYTMRESATAEMGAEQIRVPRISVVMVSWTPESGWLTSTSGRRLHRAKADAAIGVHVIFESEYAKAGRIVVLWRRDKP